MVQNKRSSGEAGSRKAKPSAQQGDLEIRPNKKCFAEGSEITKEALACLSAIVASSRQAGKRYEMG